MKFWLSGAERDLWYILHIQSLCYYGTIHIQLLCWNENCTESNICVYFAERFLKGIAR